MLPDFPVRQKDSGLPLSLLQLLSNTLVLYQTVPYLPPASVLALASTSHSFRKLIFGTPNVFRRLDLTQVEKARNAWIVEPPKGCGLFGTQVFDMFRDLQKHAFLRDVQILILDGLHVSNNLLSDIILHDSLRVRILSIRELKILYEEKLHGALLHAMTRPGGASLEGLYVFGWRDVIPASKLRSRNKTHKGILMHTTPDYNGILGFEGAQIGGQIYGEAEPTFLEDADRWYKNCGRAVPEPPSKRWASLLELCRGRISFDAVLCRGPRHFIHSSSRPDSAPWYTRPDVHIEPKVATHAVGGCSNCHTAPEGFSTFGKSPLDRFPLLAPPPLHSPTIKAAKTPFSSTANGSLHSNKLLVRCLSCLEERYCSSCHKWWCESCYRATIASAVTTKPPWDVICGAYKADTDSSTEIKVHMGLCVANCLVREMMSGAGSNGMWG